MMNQRSQGAFYYYCFKTIKTQNFTIKLSNHLVKVNQSKTHLRFCSSYITTRLLAVAGELTRRGEQTLLSVTQLLAVASG